MKCTDYEVESFEIVFITEEMLYRQYVESREIVISTKTQKWRKERVGKWSWSHQLQYLCFGFVEIDPFFELLGLSTLRDTNRAADIRS